MATAIVSGALANKPFNGGEAWVRLSWLLGLRRLGFDVYFVEQLAADACVDSTGRPTPFAESANRAYFDTVVREFGLEDCACLVCDSGEEVGGIGLEKLIEAATEAELLVNISGHLRLSRLLAAPRVRIYVDLDPGFTQAWHADTSVPFRLAAHDHYVTVGLNVGAPRCPVPDCGLHWIATLPPVLLDEWGWQPGAAGPLRFTTVATWRSPYGTISVGGRQTGLKHHEFRRLIELPGLVDEVVFEIALDIHPRDRRDREALLEHGWRLVDPREVAGTPATFRDYVASSDAEFSVAQGVYVESASGWFSDRTAAYLATGKPTLVQDTGLPTGLLRGEGLLAFGSLEEARVGVERIRSTYDEQSAKARAIAMERLDSDRVLERLLAAIGSGDDCV